MPELPEVETTITGLQKKVLSRAFVDVWTDWEKTIKKPSFNSFKKEIKDKKIKSIWRKGKNIVFGLSDKYSLLIHLKMTGHLLYGLWEFKDNVWVSKDKYLKEKVNGYIHVMFFLDNKKMLALSDLRKFAKVELWETNELKKELDKLGPEPLDIGFQEFKERFKNKKGKIKQVLMDQNVIVGIGNIYSDEILWEAKIHPLKDVSQLNNQELKNIFQKTKQVLQKAIKAKGTSVSDYRMSSGEKGGFAELRKVYQRKTCPICDSLIKKIKVGGRTAHFCPKRQKL